MTKGQKLYKKSINIATSSLFLVSALLTISYLVLDNNQVEAEVTSINNPLIPGNREDTGFHDYSDLSESSLHSMNSWTALGTTKLNIPGANWFGMTDDIKNQAGYVIFKGAIDSSKAFSISGYFRTASGSMNYKDSGDSNGFILTPESLDQINENSIKYIGNSNTSKPVVYPTGPGLGIGGLNGSIFAGRDLYYNSPGSGLAADSGNGAIDGIYDGPFTGTGVSGASPAVSIRTTRTMSGSSIISGDTSIGKPGELVYGSGSTTTTGVGTSLGYPNAKGPDTSYYTVFGSNSTQDDIMTLTWSNPVETPDKKGYIGTLSLKVQGMNSDGLSSGDPVTISQTSLTLPKSVSVGTIGATGGNYGMLSFSNNYSKVTGNRGQKDVKVNYVNAITGKKISSCETTSINSNVGDVVNIISPSGIGISYPGLPGKFEFIAPDHSTFSGLKGYTFNKITYGGEFDENTGVLIGDGITDPNGSAGSEKGITVSNFNSITNPNQINVFYTPKIETVFFNACYLAGTPGTSVMGTDKINNIDFSLPSPTPTTLGFASSPPIYSPTTGYIDSIAPPPSVSNMPIGYSVIQVIAPNGKVYTTSGAVTAGYSSALTYALAENPITDSSSIVSSGFTNSFLIMLGPEKHDATWQFKYDAATPGYGGNEGTNTLPPLPTFSKQQGVTGLPMEVPSETKLPLGYKVSQIVDGKGNTYSGLDDITSPNVFIKKYFPYIFMNAATYSGSTMKPPTFGTESSFMFLVSPIQQSGKVNFKYNVGTPGTNNQGNPVVDNAGNPIPVTDSSKGTLGIVSSLPEDLPLHGVTGETLSFDLSKSIPEGYEIDSVVAPDGTRYKDDTAKHKTALQLALAANPYFEDSSLSTNRFTVYLRALQNITTSIYIKMNKNDVPDGTSIPEEQKLKISTGLVGSPISNSDINHAITNLTSGGGVLDITSQVYNNWYITSLNGPNNSILDMTGQMNNKIAIQKLADLIALNPYILAKSNDFVIYMDYIGTLSLTVPSFMDFGSHDISGKPTVYKGRMDNAVSIIDSRVTPTPWTLSVQQSSPLTGYVNKLGLMIPSLELSDSVHFLDNEGNDTLLTKGVSATVYRQTKGTNDIVEALVNDSKVRAGFYLETFADKQIAKWCGDEVIYKGEVLWTLSNTP